MARTVFPEWRRQNETTRYPFAATATLAHGSGRSIPPGVFLDAALYPVGHAAGGLHLARVAVSFRTLGLSVGTPAAPDAAVGSVDLDGPPADQVALADRHGRPAGVLVVDGRRLAGLRSWGVGVYDFEPEQTEFCASCVFPTPEAGVRGVRLDDGSFFAGDVWLVGGDGVVLRVEDGVVPGPRGCGGRPVRLVRVDVVGDPLFRRRLCQDSGVFRTPRFVRRVRVVGPNAEFVVPAPPDGRFHVTVADDLAADTVLRVTPRGDGRLEIGAAGAVVGR